MMSLCGNLRSKLATTAKLLCKNGLRRLHFSPWKYCLHICLGCDHIKWYHHDPKLHKDRIFMGKYRAIQVCFYEIVFLWTWPPSQHYWPLTFAIHEAIDIFTIQSQLNIINFATVAILSRITNIDHLNRVVELRVRVMWVQRCIRAVP